MIQITQVDDSDWWEVWRGKRTYYKTWHNDKRGWKNYNQVTIDDQVRFTTPEVAELLVEWSD